MNPNRSIRFGNYPANEHDGALPSLLFMSNAMLALLNILFFVFHTLWMAFNCCGWYWRRTRRWHLLTVALTALSWLVLGYWYGWGYCLCTDWHYRVRDQLGYPSPRSYTQLLVVTLTGVTIGSDLADGVTAGVFAIVTILAIVLNIRDWYRKA